MDAFITATAQVREAWWSGPSPAWPDQPRAALMAALLITTAFTDVFRSTLVFGLPFPAVLVLLYYFRYRPAVRDLRTN
jgi:hypothetical protein